MALTDEDCSSVGVLNLQHMQRFMLSSKPYGISLIRASVCCNPPDKIGYTQDLQGTEEQRQSHGIGDSESLHRTADSTIRDPCDSQGNDRGPSAMEVNDLTHSFAKMSSRQHKPKGPRGRGTRIAL